MPNRKQDYHATGIIPTINSPSSIVFLRASLGHLVCWLPTAAGAAAAGVLVMQIQSLPSVSLAFFLPSLLPSFPSSLVPSCSHSLSASPHPATVNSWGGRGSTGALLSRHGTPPTNQSNPAACVNRWPCHPQSVLLSVTSECDIPVLISTAPKNRDPLRAGWLKPLVLRPRFYCRTDRRPRFLRTIPQFLQIDQRTPANSSFTDPAVLFPRDSYILYFTIIHKNSSTSTRIHARNRSPKLISYPGTCRT